MKKPILNCMRCKRPMSELEEEIRDSQMFQELKRWRKQQAEDESKPAYMVLFDRYLLSIVLIHPVTHEELRSCKGFQTGSKGAAYGGAILAITARYDKSKSDFDNSSCSHCEGSHDELLDDTRMEPLRDPDNPSMGEQWRVSRCRCCGQPLPGGGEIVGEGEPLDWLLEIYEAEKKNLFDIWKANSRNLKVDPGPGSSDLLDKLRNFKIALKETSEEISRKELNNRKDGEPVVEITMRSNSLSDLVKRFEKFVDEPNIGRITDAKDPQFPFLWRPVWNQPDGDKEGYWEITFRHAYRD